MASGKRQLRVEGDDKVIALCQELPRRAQKKAFRGAVTAGTDMILKAAKARAPRRHGLLKKALGKKIKAYKSGTVVGIVGARRSVTGEKLGLRAVPANYIHLVVKGTRPHMVGSRRHPGAKANDFMGDAYRATKGKCEAAAAVRFKNVVEEEATKLGK